MAVYAQADLGYGLAFGLQIVLSDTGTTTTTTVTLEGEWDLAEQYVARDVIQAALERNPRRVVLDLSRLTFMDSTGIHGVIELAQDAARLKIELVVIPGPRAVQRLFEICQLTDRITFVTAA